MSVIFISYRRDDTAPYAGRVYDRLTAHFGAGHVFMDIDQVEPGDDFVEVINHKVSACETAIVLIGKNWLSVTDAQGKRRLDDPEDFVRLEVAAVLERKVRVVPVLVGGASMPRMQDLPRALAPLGRRNAVEISDSRFHRDVDRLIEGLEKEVSASASPSARQPGGGPDASAQATSTGHANESGRDTSWRGSASGSARRGVTRWQIVAGAALGVAVLALIAVRGFNTPLPPAPDANAPEASAESVPTVLLTGDAKNHGRKQSLVEYVKEMRQELTPRAIAGSAPAQFELGVLFETSEPRNLEESAKWYKLAASQGYPLAEQGMDDVKKLAQQGNNALDSQVTMRQLERKSAQFRIMRERIDKANEAAKREIQSLGR